MEQVPLESLVVRAAHWDCDLSEDRDTPLRARARLLRASPRDIEPAVSSPVAEALGEALRDDSTWTALWSELLPGLVARSAGGEGRPTVENVERFAAAMGKVVDASAREPGRSARVAGLAAELAGRVGAPARERVAIRVAALLMDIGQLGVPRSIVQKPDVLTVDEMELVRHHPGWGARIIDGVPGLDQIARWVEAHHERPDGRGYSEQLTGDEVPLASRILAVADAYWALRAERPYREAYSAAEAVGMIESSAGTQYDAELTELLPAALSACEAEDAS
jgi:HD-GYP domain-containing protein (c-di-GMP phosphodiesterase class II)